MKPIPHKNNIFAKLLRHKSQRTCAYCGRIGPLEVDHILPKSRGGSDYILNLQFVCRTCNAKKGNRWNWKKTVGGD